MIADFCGCKLWQVVAERRAGSAHIRPAVAARNEDANAKAHINNVNLSSEDIINDSSSLPQKHTAAVLRGKGVKLLSVVLCPLLPNR